jgi:hypothetical protein
VAAPLKTAVTTDILGWESGIGMHYR